MHARTHVEHTKQPHTSTHLFRADVEDVLLRAGPAGQTGPAGVEVEVGALALRHGAAQLVRL